MRGRFYGRRPGRCPCRWRTTQRPGHIGQLAADSRQEMDGTVVRDIFCSHWRVVVVANFLVGMSPFLGGPASAYVSAPGSRGLRAPGASVHAARPVREVSQRTPDPHMWGPYKNERRPDEKNHVTSLLKMLAMDRTAAACFLGLAPGRRFQAFTGRPLVALGAHLRMLGPLPEEIGLHSNTVVQVSGVRAPSRAVCVRSWTLRDACG
jgi:hypothetical protein